VSPPPTPRRKGRTAIMTNEELTHYLDQRVKKLAEKLEAEARCTGLTDTDEIARYMRDHLAIDEMADDVRNYPGVGKVVQELIDKQNAN
jgi:hypothetical protein